MWTSYPVCCQPVRSIPLSYRPIRAAEPALPRTAADMSRYNVWFPAREWLRIRADQSRSESINNAADTDEPGLFWPANAWSVRITLKENGDATYSGDDSGRQTASLATLSVLTCF